MNYTGFFPFSDKTEDQTTTGSGKKRKRKSENPRKSSSSSCGGVGESGEFFNAPTSAVDGIGETFSEAAPSADDVSKGRDMSDLIKMLETATEDELPNWCPISIDGQNNAGKLCPFDYAIETHRHVFCPRRNKIPRGL